MNCLKTFSFSEFSSQLPHDGGAFYSNESIENVRPYYRSAWPPMLYAAALWLSSGGFENITEEDEAEDSLTTSVTSKTMSSTTKTQETINTDRFYLLLGRSHVFIVVLMHRAVVHFTGALFPSIRGALASRRHPQL